MLAAVSYVGVSTIDIAGTYTYYLWKHHKRQERDRQVWYCHNIEVPALARSR